MTNDERRATSDEHGLLAHVRRRLEEHTTVPAQLDAINQRLDALGEAVQRLEERPNSADDLAAQYELSALRETVAALEKQIGRAGREQFKANALAETQAAQLGTALDALRAADERRAAELEALRERHQAALTEARLDVIRAILPALDGLDEALRSGQQVLAQHERPTTNDQRPTTNDQRPTTNDQRGLKISVVDTLRGLLGERPRVDAARQETEALRAGLEAWLVGLTFVRRRLLDALAAEGVAPMNAAGKPFDPHYHIAVEVVSAAGLAPGTIAHERRRGYLAGGRVLRPAEVAVVADERPRTSDQ